MPKYLPVDALASLNAKLYKHAHVGCLVLSHDNKIVLQQRDDYAPTFPNYLSTFGGAIEQGESPLEAMVRELHEELGALAQPRQLISLSIRTEDETHHSRIAYLYFWHDKNNTITGCYEGDASYFDDVDRIKRHPKLMDDVLWLIRECQKRSLIKM